MDIEIIIQSIMGLVALLAILILFLFIVPNPKKENKKAKIQPKMKENLSTKTDNTNNTDFEYLVSIIKNKESMETELEEALKLIIKYHGTIHPKLGLRAHPDFDPYMDVLFRICRHPNANKDMIINFDKDLVGINPDYAKDINEAMTRGLNSRRV